MIKKPVDISWSRGETLAERGLSNLAPHPFSIDGRTYASMEGFLQSLKFESDEDALELAALSGYEAFKTGQRGNGWKKTQILFYLGVPMLRRSGIYGAVLTRAYDAWLDQNETVRDLLVSTVGSALIHSRGKTDPTDTVLTRVEYVGQLNRLRFRALDESWITMTERDVERALKLLRTIGRSINENRFADAYELSATLSAVIGGYGPVKHELED